MPFDRIVKLKPDNFTPLQRTPWAGTDIGLKIKSKILPAFKSIPIGESWEFSCDPDFPSKLLDGNTLPNLIASSPNDALGPKFAPDCEVLVKLLHAAEPLSVQVHPSDDDKHLKPEECGKPESWYVISNDDNCGIYLGFKKPMSKEDLRAALTDGEAAKDLLHFVPVKPGDYFELEPGVPHAVGPGVLLLEPQRIVYGKSGKTYRLWDWGRRYNAKGERDANGSPRQLHVEEGLRLVDPQTQVGDDFVEQTKRTPRVKVLESGVVVKSFPANPYYQLHVLAADKSSHFELSIDGSYAAVIALGNSVWRSAKGRDSQVLVRGESAFLPYAAGKQFVEMDTGSTIAIVHPTGATLVF